MHWRKNSSIVFLLAILTFLPSYLDMTVRGENSTISVENRIFAVEWSPDGSLIAIGTEQGVKVYTSDLQTTTTLPSYTNNIISLSWHPNSEYIAGIGYPHTYELRDSFSGVPIFTSSILIWQRNSDNSFMLIHQRDYPNQPNVVASSWSPDGAKLAVRVNEILHPFNTATMNTIQVFDTNTWNLISTSTDIYESMYSELEWDPNSQKLAIGGETFCSEERPPCPPSSRIGGEQLFILDASTGQILDSTITRISPTAISWSDNNRIAFSELNYQIRDATDLSIEIAYYDSRQVSGIEWVFNDTELLLWFPEIEINIVDPTTFESRATIPIPDIRDFALSPDNTQLVGFTDDGTVSILDIPAPVAVCDVTVTASDVSGLVSAINTANSSSGADTICLEASTYTLNAVQNNNYGPNGLPAITSDITLVGLGGGATIERAGGSPSFRFFRVTSGGTLTLDNLTLSGGDESNGGAIYNAVWCNDDA